LAPCERSELFQRIVAQTLDALRERGLNVLPAAVEDVLDGVVTSAAERSGMDFEETLHLADPHEIATLIARADADEHALSVRPLREDPGTARLTIAAGGQLLKALAQTAKYAIRNHDEPIADHAADLVTELGAALLDATAGDEIIVPRGVLAESAQLLDHAADRFTAGTWSTCPCGKDHGQPELDALLPDPLHSDADLARHLLMRAIVDG
jgi:hypothetical protein